MAKTISVRMGGTKKNTSELISLYKYVCKSAGIPEQAKNDIERIEVIKKQYNKLKKLLSNEQEKFHDINQRINNILDVIMSLASLDYSKKADISGEGDHIDALAVGINMLGEELEQSTISLSEKEVLLKEIHHRVKNNLQLVCSLLNIQSSYISDPETLALFRESQNRVNSMSLIHEKLYTSKDFSRINFSDYITSIANYLTAVYNIDPSRIKVKIDIQQDSGFLPLDTALPCGLIVNELLSNSFKYAFPGNQGGEIIFRLSRSKEKRKAKYTMELSDNGIGLPEGMDIFKTESLGLQLVTTLVEQIEGTITTQNKNGTFFKITFNQ